MKISIITVCYNSEKTIADTLESIKVQDHSDIELIVIDGASSDGTLQVIEKYRDIISVFISEPDMGIYDAMNKGMALATGDIVGILNSDDLLAHPSVLSHINSAFSTSNADCLYGNLVYVRTNDVKKIIRFWDAGQTSVHRYLYGWAPPHPTFYVRRNVIAECGSYDLRFKIAADYEFMLRLMVKYKKKAVYLNEVMVWMRQGGVSNSSLKNRKRSFRENREAWRANGLQPFFFTVYCKMVRKLIQFFNHRSYNNTL